MNGQIVGGCQEEKRFVEKFKRLRKLGFINYSVSVFENEIDKIIEIWSDSGRMIRPLINRKELEEQKEKFVEIIQQISQLDFQRDKE